MARSPSIEVEIDTHVSMGIVRPGDKLVVATGRPLSMHEADTIRQHLEHQLPGVEVVPIEADALVVYRAGNAAHGLAAGLRSEMPTAGTVMAAVADEISAKP